MNSLRRTIAASVLAVPLTLGTAGIALADGFEQHNATAGPDGASVSAVYAGTEHDGISHAGDAASYLEINSTAGPDGASSEYVLAVVDEDGNVTFSTGSDNAGPDGAESTSVSSSAGHED